MRILLIGSGGREHSLAWKIAQSPLLEQLWIAPGNPGTALHGTNVDLAVSDSTAVAAFAQEHGITLAVIGPEVPLVDGLADALREVGVAVFGPSKAAAELEGSKAYCKEVMSRHRIPTGGHRLFRNVSAAISYLESDLRYPVVVKASGLAAGKGVVIAESAEVAKDAARNMLERKAFGDAGDVILVEEFINGYETSAFCLTDGKTFMPLETCQDHKALLDGGKGPNTGGMGVISPNAKISDRMDEAIEREVMLPTLHGMNHEGRRFSGVLFAGLMMTAVGPKVLEYNVRFGDPECQVLMMRFKSDLVPYLLACANGNLDELEAPEWDSRAACCVVLASGGYPASYETSIPIQGVDAIEQDETLQVFHAGTTLDSEGQLLTAGGRVLAVTALGENMGQARERAYAACDAIEFEGKTLRRDIGRAAADSFHHAT